MQNKELLKEKAEVFKALGHPTRLYMVESLAKGEKCVCEFVDEIKADFSTISKHLTVLKKAGLIEGEKRGKWVHYRLTFTCVESFIECVEDNIKERFKRKASLME
jgi:ArsR family transcriptional regulator